MGTSRSSEAHGPRHGFLPAPDRALCTMEAGRVLVALGLGTSQCQHPPVELAPWALLWDQLLRAVMGWTQPIMCPGDR